MNVPNSIEMGVYPFVSDVSLKEDEELIGTSFGSIKVDIYGERSKYPIVTFHDIGMNAANNFENFFQFHACSELMNRFCIYNINAPGQEIDAKKLPTNYHYPTMDELSQIIDETAAHFCFKSFIGIGIGAGANVFLRYALNHSDLLDALVMINATSQRSGWIEWFYQKWNLNSLRSGKMTQFTVDYLMWHHFGRHLEECNSDIMQQYRSYFWNHPNPGNLMPFFETFLNRTDVVLRDPKSSTGFLLNVPVLQIVGANSAFINESVYVSSQLDPKITEWLKISDSCGLVLDDKPLEVLQAFLLFIQGHGFCSNLNVLKFMSALKEKREGKKQFGDGTGPIIDRVDESVDSM